VTLGLEHVERVNLAFGDAHLGGLRVHVYHGRLSAVHAAQID